MTAAALLVVLGAALLMQLGGLSMAMGAFLAGVLLSESTFRHQLEAEIEPFRGLLLGLFFLGVGMALDLSVIATDWRSVLLWVLAFMTFKAAAIYAVARLTGAGRREAVYRSALMAQGGEFAFVGIGLATGALLSTALISRPIHVQLGIQGNTPELVSRLIATDWIRNVLEWGRTALYVWALSRLIAPGPSHSR